MQRKTAAGFGMAAMAAAIAIAACERGGQELDAAHHPEAHGSH